jgi:hypothetical protein
MFFLIDKMEDNDECFVCKKYKGAPCKSCGFIRYCSVECREKDRSHEIVCGLKKIFYFRGAYHVADRLIAARESEVKTFSETLYLKNKGPETLCGALESLAETYKQLDRGDLAAFVTHILECIDPDGMLRKRLKEALETTLANIDTSFVKFEDD